MTGRQESQRDMASVNIRTRRRPSVPCGTWTGESSAVGLCALTTQPVRKTRRSSKVSVRFFLSVLFQTEVLCSIRLGELQLSALSVRHRFGNRSAHYWVSLWGQHPAAGSPRVHQPSCGQSATWADVWTYETDEGRLVYCLSLYWQVFQMLYVCYRSSWLTLSFP